jgi:sec-independent protein translocase protein TatC
VLTPTPDPFNQTLMAGPMFLLYWLGVFSAKFFGKKKPLADQVGVPAVAMAAAGAGTTSSGAMSKPSEGDYVGVPTDRRR